MMAAITASETSKVVLLEKNEKLGKKLYITGKGRCNLTNLSDVSDILENIPSNPQFMYSSLYAMDAYELVKFFNELGLTTKTERGNRVFPKSDKASDVISAMEKKLIRQNVDIRLNTAVENLIIKDGRAVGVILSNKNEVYAQSIIIATGGLSYPRTGSTGDGYKMADSAGHKIMPCYPSLVGLLCTESWVSGLAGLTLKNIGIKVTVDGREVYSDFGELLFTHKGVSGPVILSASRHITKNIKSDNSKIYIDLKPALDTQELDRRIQNDFSKFKNKNFGNSLNDLLPQRLISAIISLSGINEEKKVNEITRTERRKLVELFKSLELNIKGTEGFNSAVITCGGVCVGEVNPSTMESKLVKGLYFCGEVLDVDGFTGGYNLQIAFSTGYLAGRSINNLK